MVDRRVILKAAGLVAAPALMGFPVFAAEPAPVVETRSGKVRGAAADGVDTFKGIPYAQSTAGANRFRPPVPMKPWAGIRDTVAFGHSAPQPAAAPSPLNAWYGTIEAIGEDCLSLNIFTAAVKKGAKKPVMVWIHGGAWSSCASSAPGFDGTNLARLGDVVVVTVNHRLNLFGYLKIEDKDQRFADSGNAGLLDLVAALKWVRDNIAGFGGDPDNVTIFGQSGGAAKVTALLAMPAAHGLFHKAIAESCSGSLRICGEEEAGQLSHGLAQKLGIDKPSGAALQAVPLDQLVSAYQTIPNAFRPVLDGRSFKQNPFDPTAPVTAANIPLMIGNAADEARLYMAADLKNFSLDAAEVHKRVGRFLQIGDGEADRVLDAYHSSLPDGSPSDLLGAIATDFTYRRNTTHEAALQAETAQAPVYAYVFDWKTPVLDGVLKTPHTLEVPFVFGTSEAAAPLVGTGPELARLTKLLTQTWAAFAHTGNPNNPGLPTWPRYDGKSRGTMVLSLDSKVASNPGGDRRQALDGIPIYEYRMPINYVRA